MTENEFLLSDRIVKIKSINEQYDLENNAYLSFSGGKDSTVLHYLLDEALPGNKIPRVYSDTGIELNSVRKFVYELKEKDERITIIKPTENIRKILEQYGYPFKSKKHSRVLKQYQTNGLENKYTRVYLGLENTKKGTPCFRGCPKKLKFQFTPEYIYRLKVSDMCCMKLKEERLKKYQIENNKPISIVGIRREEGGRRMKAQCAMFNGNKLDKFQPLAPITEDWENYFIELKNIKLAEVYYPPYNFKRTGCKGCPFAVDLKDELETLSRFFPAERKQCEMIWKPVYDEYRRIGYRLEKEDKFKLFTI